MASNTMTTIEIGTSRSSATCKPAAGISTRNTSSPAYAVEEIASDANTARAIVFGSRWCPSSELASGLPTSTRLITDGIDSSAASRAHEELTHSVLAVGGHEHEHLVAFQQRCVTSGHDDVVLTEDRHDGRVTREPQLDDLAVDRRRVRGERHLDQPRPSALEAEQAHEASNGHRFLHQRGEQVRRRD